MPSGRGEISNFWTCLTCQIGCVESWETYGLNCQVAALFGGTNPGSFWVNVPCWIERITQIHHILADFVILDID